MPAVCSAREQARPKLPRICEVARRRCKSRERWRRWFQGAGDRQSRLRCCCGSFHTAARFRAVAQRGSPSAKLIRPRRQALTKSWYKPLNAHRDPYSPPRLEADLFGPILETPSNHASGSQCTCQPPSRQDLPCGSLCRHMRGSTQSTWYHPGSRTGRVGESQSHAEHSAQRNEGSLYQFPLQSHQDLRYRKKY